jgi:hypothetical protein
MSGVQGYKEPITPSESGQPPPEVKEVRNNLFPDGEADRRPPTPFSYINR